MPTIDPNNLSSGIGTSGDDTFYLSDSAFEQLVSGRMTLDGGAGNDTLYLTGGDDYDLRVFAKVSGIENIVFAADQMGGLHITPQQLAGVQTITGAADYAQSRIYLSGAALPTSTGEEPPANARLTYDLRGTHFTGNYVFMTPSPYADIIVSDKSQLFSASGDLALLQPFSEQAGARIHLVGGTFTAAERQLLRHDGAVYIWDSSDDTAANAAPTITALAGDHVETRNGDPVYIDAGQNAQVGDDGAIRKITVSILHADAHDWIDVANNGLLEFPNGIVEGGRIRDATVFNGKVFANLYNVTNSSFDVLFNGEATQDYVNKLVHSLIYYNDGSAATAERQIQISVTDGADKTTTSTVSVTHTAQISAPASGGTTQGTADANVIAGGKGSDMINAWAGDDTLSGGAGKDVLTGGSGKDAFVFDTRPGKTNIDKITDFNVKDDSVWLDNAVFKKLGKGTADHPGKLNKGFFTLGDHAKDKNDYVIYDNKKGILWYDADGSGHGKAVEIATLKKGLHMTYKDFFVI